MANNYYEARAFSCWSMSPVIKALFGAFALDARPSGNGRGLHRSDCRDQ